MWPMDTRLPQNTAATIVVPMPAHFGTRLRGFVDALVRGRDLLLQEQRGVREAALDVDLGELTAGAQLRHHAVGHHVDRDAARDLARVVAAHAVGEHRDAGFAVHEDGVLVVRADHARMGQACDVEWHGLGHAG